MIADRIESIDVALHYAVHGSGRSGHLLVKHLVAQPLRTAYVDSAARQPDLERTEPPQRFSPFGRRALDAQSPERSDFWKQCRQTHETRVGLRSCIHRVGDVIGDSRGAQARGKAIHWIESTRIDGWSASVTHACTTIP